MGIDHVEPQIVQRFADRDLLARLVYIVDCGENGALRGAVAVVEGIARRRCDGCKLLSSDGKVQEGMVLDARGELEAYLGGHEYVGNDVRLKVGV